MLGNNNYGFGRIILTLVIAMALKIAPLPDNLAVYNPDWVLLALIYWSLAFPERVGIFHAWFFGLLNDVLTGLMFGQFALAYSLVIYVCLLAHKANPAIFICATSPVRVLLPFAFPNVAVFYQKYPTNSRIEADFLAFHFCRDFELAFRLYGFAFYPLVKTH